MLHVPSEFPHTGSRAFERGTGRPVTILQHCVTRGALVRRDDLPRPGESIIGSAAGNCRIELDDLVASEEEASLTIGSANPKRRRRKSGK